jgi:hypothetical protein
MLVTVQQHILQQQDHQFPAARANFSSPLSGMTLATNLWWETQQKLDVSGTSP